VKATFMYRICNITTVKIKIIYFVFVCVLATIRSTVDACDITDHDLGKLVAGLLEVRKTNHYMCLGTCVFHCM